ncbi:MAG: hypothetical protein MJD61_08525 [Proteobacteria bacterium]|nr:hypothetical protein [Pseudomonadota bacterium]
MADVSPGLDAAEADPLELQDALSPFKTRAWQELTPAERLRRAWELRRRLPDAQAAHDRKLFPAP